MIISINWKPQVIFPHYKTFLLFQTLYLLVIRFLGGFFSFFSSFRLTNTQKRRFPVFAWALIEKRNHVFKFVWFESFIVNVSEGMVVLPWVGVRFRARTSTDLCYSILSIRLWCLFFFLFVLEFSYWNVSYCLWTIILFVYNPYWILVVK